MKTILTFLGLLLAWPGHSQSTLGEGDTFAWAANFGWIQLTPNRPNPGDGVVVADTHLSGFAWSDSTGWINFGDGTPANGIRYGNTDGADSGVNHDGAGNLSGLAWSPNLGWINFGWATANDANRPRFDLISGNFSGYAWSAGAGWVTLSSGLLKTDFMSFADTDTDGISDAWERENAGPLTVLTATGDADGDGASDKAEYLADTDPLAGADHLTVLAFTPGPTQSALTWTSRPTRLYRIGQSTDLTQWSFGSVFAPDAGTQTSRAALHGEDRRRFFRVESVLPLQR